METESAIPVPEYSNDDAEKSENPSLEPLPSSKSAPELPIITTVYHKSKNKRVHYMAQVVQRKSLFHRDAEV